MGLLFDRLYVNLEGRIERVEPKEWARPLFRDVAALVGDHGCPQLTSNARHVATLAGLEPQ
jgi:hypothetical protein